MTLIFYFIPIYNYSNFCLCTELFVFLSNNFFSLRYFIEFAYNGRAYCGWQSQPHSISVQEVMEQSVSTLLRTPISLVGAGRTDSGVHARQMFAHFDYPNDIPNNLKDKLNAFLPKDISVKDIHKVDTHAHARFDAIKRSYQYHISLIKNPFSTDFAYYFPWELDIEMMNEACKILLLHSDFQCFSKSRTDVKTYICEISEARFVLEGTDLTFYISADRFLRNMVRAIVGTLLEVGRHKLSLDGFEKVIESKNRSQAGYSVPGHALYLVEVVYPENIFIEKNNSKL